MNDVYGDVPDWRRLVPRERDVVTGRLTGQRDDKRRHDRDQHDADSNTSSQHARSTPGRSLASVSTSASVPAVIAAAVAVLAIVVVGGVLGARALGGSADEDPNEATGRSGASSPGAGPGSPGSGVTPGSGGSAAPSAGGSATGAPAQVASAITLEYSGGRVTVDECSDPSGQGGCEKFDSTQYDPLTVRCTANGCTVYFVKEGPLTGPLTMSGTTSAATQGCQETSWTVTLTPVGEAVTEGIRHPARIVGQAHLSRVAEQLPTVSCLGAEQTYVYDASPS